jgi:hypothetical protein
MRLFSSGTAAAAALLAAMVAFGSAAPVQAQEVIARYTAYIGTDDLYNSNGVRLREPWQILRQDRANYHRFGIRQPGDEGDPFFANADNRAIMERMVRDGWIDPQASRDIVAGGAMVVVTIYGSGMRGNHVQVDVYR